MAQDVVVKVSLQLRSETSLDIDIRLEENCGIYNTLMRKKSCENIMVPEVSVRIYYYWAIELKWVVFSYSYGTEIRSNIHDLLLLYLESIDVVRCCKTILYVRMVVW